MKKTAILLILLSSAFVSLNSFKSVAVTDKKVNSAFTQTIKTANFGYTVGPNYQGVITLKYGPTGVYTSVTAVLTGVANMQMTLVSHSPGTFDNVDQWKGDYVAADGTEYIVTFSVTGGNGNWQISNVSPSTIV
ncbi:hypothetical protein SAMN05216464_104218 [Mucilaginibacter pineti]|uniref:Uncharacterized protein n=1 Tax=Mucilaginibacter pineti TaxID=1391627 RepID=A0A1G7AQT7_9SPHI|nr:hypothetical protein [Mucilaginibacter pineti]SDE17248.1 hypothetical protein SAMN05216464_104218 [Mucilaginibacter pineti]